jgi:hypothetical protein
MKTIKIGTRKDNDIVIDDGYVSGYHCEIKEKKDGTYILEDKDSLHGTAINGIQQIKNEINLDNEILIAKRHKYTLRQILTISKKTDKNDFSVEFLPIKEQYEKKLQNIDRLQNILLLFRLGIPITLSVLVYRNLSYLMNNELTTVASIVFPILITYTLFKKIPKIQTFYLAKLNGKYVNKFNCPNVSCKKPMESSDWKVSELEKCPSRCGAKFI